MTSNCGGAVEALLKAHDEPASYLDQPAVELAELNRTIDEPPITERPGSMIGPYKLKEQIGEGGFGLVFVAEQQEPVGEGRAQSHQAGHGHARGHGPVHGRAAGAGNDGSSKHRAGVGCRGDRLRPALFRHGTGPRHSDY